MCEKESALKALNKLWNLLSEAVAQKSSANKFCRGHMPNSIFNKGAAQLAYYTEALAETCSCQFCKTF